MDGIGGDHMIRDVLPNGLGKGRIPIAFFLENEEVSPFPVAEGVICLAQPCWRVVHQP